MDAIKFIKEQTRMCESFGTTCVGCPMHPSAKKARYDCRTFIKTGTEQAVAIVEKWSKEHPVMTNRQKMIEVFGINGLDSADVRPSWLDAEYKEPKGEE